MLASQFIKERCNHCRGETVCEESCCNTSPSPGVGNVMRKPKHKCTVCFGYGVVLRDRRTGTVVTDRFIYEREFNRR